MRDLYECKNMETMVKTSVRRLQHLTPEQRNQVSKFKSRVISRNRKVIKRNLEKMIAKFSRKIEAGRMKPSTADSIIEDYCKKHHIERKD